jgi:hypothetical protein
MMQHPEPSRRDHSATLITEKPIKSFNKRSSQEHLSCSTINHFCWNRFDKLRHWHSSTVDPRNQFTTDFSHALDGIVFV